MELPADFPDRVVVEEQLRIDELGDRQPGDDSDTEPWPNFPGRWLVCDTGRPLERAIADRA
jgi:hypothetical protein